MKATNGWTDMTIGEIETVCAAGIRTWTHTHILQQLPPPPARQRPRVSVVTERSNPSSPKIPYEPPSPSRPWQLIDVLWQPLPPPSNGNARYPTSPVSPNKRSRDDGRFEDHPSWPSPNGHRRASSSVTNPSYVYTDPYPSSPLRELREGEKKRRSYSHSHHPRQRSETTVQDVDAAKALTSMLGSGSSSQGSDSSGRRTFMQAPLLPATSSTSLPIPTSPQYFPARPRATSVTLTPETTSPRPPSSRPSNLRTPSSHTRSRMFADTSDETDRGEEDNSAAELMMYLAHSPSPMKRSNPSAFPVRTTGGAARVLFADAGEAAGGVTVTQHSNLASAPPITAATNEEKKGFGRGVEENG